MIRANIFTSVLLCGALWAQSATPAPSSDQPKPSETQPNTSAANKPPAQSTKSRYHRERFPKRAVQYYGLVWGVDSLSVKSVESGELIRFSYRVLDAHKAQALNDKKADPELIDPRAGVKLVIPSLEKVGKLRQSTTPEAGKSYWMAFSNKGRYVKPGDRVIVVIGNFRADGLVVD